MFSNFLQKLFLLSFTVIVFNAIGQTNISGIKPYDLVILNGRVIDPESKLDAVRNIGINNGTIKTITNKALKGRKTINACSDINRIRHIILLILLYR